FFYSNAALSTGTGAPLTTSQLADYQKETQDTMIAYAEQDRVGRSPLDISSPYTFLGSIVSNYYKYAYVPNNVMQTVLSSIGYTLSQPLKMLTTNTYAATNDMTALYSHASEFGVDPSVAVGPYGDLATGIPTQYSDASTTDVYNTVSSQVDENSGQPNDDSDIQAMLTDCGDGSLLNAAGCTITDQKRADESLYLSDLRINDMLDGTNTDQDSSSSAGTGSTTVDEANLFNDSTSIACAPGTEDAGNDTGYNQGKPIPIHLCKLPNTYLTDKNTPGLVNARASGVALAMFDQMKKDLGLSTVALNDSFRTMAEQEQARAEYGTQAAEPGYSNHQMGYAFDINMGSANGGNSSSYSAGVNTSYPGNPVWEWLSAHASTYHFSQYSREGWHWSIDGR
ncbi:MAG TPA: M15 family metallopeptidase, partial [Dongiaceae bacterium]|nr:M15 family metallopeptidase [Dongiaceae bacterium]